MRLRFVPFCALALFPRSEVFLPFLFLPVFFTRLLRAGAWGSLTQAMNNQGKDVQDEACQMEDAEKSAAHIGTLNDRYGRRLASCANIDATQCKPSHHASHPRGDSTLRHAFARCTSHRPRGPGEVKITFTPGVDIPGQIRAGLPYCAHVYWYGLGIRPNRKQRRRWDPSQVDILRRRRRSSPARRHLGHTQSSGTGPTIPSVQTARDWPAPVAPLRLIFGHTRI